MAVGYAQMQLEENTSQKLTARASGLRWKYPLEIGMCDISETISESDDIS